jgi:hypothetical protein
MTVAVKPSQLLDLSHETEGGSLRDDPRFIVHDPHSVRCDTPLSIDDRSNNAIGSSPSR